MTAPATINGLEFAADDAKSASENVLLYAGPGVGKTTGAVATAPADRRTLLVNADTGNATKHARQRAEAAGVAVDEVRVQGKNDLRDVALGLAGDAGNVWGTVVVDPVPELYRLLVDEACGGSGMPQVQHYGEGGKTLERFARHVCKLPGLNVILVAHEEIVDGPDGALLMPMCGGNKLPGILCAMVDHVGYVGVVHEDGAEPRRVVQFAPGRGRYAKNRGGALGAVRDLNVAEWLRTIAAGGEDNPDGEVS